MRFDAKLGLTAQVMPSSDDSSIPLRSVPAYTFRPNVAKAMTRPELRATPVDACQACPWLHEIKMPASVPAKSELPIEPNALSRALSGSPRSERVHDLPPSVLLNTLDASAVWAVRNNTASWSSTTTRRMPETLRLRSRLSCLANMSQSSRPVLETQDGPTEANPVPQGTQRIKPLDAQGNEQLEMRACFIP